MKTLYIVWNETAEEGYVTQDKKLADNVKEGNIFKCYNDQGCFMSVANKFAYKYGGKKDTKILEVTSFKKETE